MSQDVNRITEREALLLHSSGRPGKLEVTATKPLATQRDLSLAYSPGVAYPCLRIAENEDSAYDYTAKSNTVAVISNGTAVLGLGNLGALASKPVMEGKAVLFKRFADIDGIDLEFDTEDVDRFCEAVEVMASSFGGINLEDIKAPESFIIEERLRENLDVPVMHDDQHGTAIIAAAGLINALELTGRSLSDMRMVVNGAGAAAIATLSLLKAMGMPPENAVMCDSRGVIYRGRTEGMNQWKSMHAVETDLRTLEEAMDGADVFFGLSVKDAITQDMVASMAAQPIIFAMANPDPEIKPELVEEVRDDAFVATGRSDYPNQVNNVLGFPYIFRGALDVRARAINDEMKIAAANAIAALAREDVPDEVGEAYGRKLKFGREYLIPAPFDPRLIVAIPQAVARAAMESGVARRPIIDMEAYAEELKGRLDPTYDRLQRVYDRARGKGQRVVFAEGEDPRAVRAALALQNGELGRPILVGRKEDIEATLVDMGLAKDALEIRNAGQRREDNPELVDMLYARLNRKGYLRRDCQRLIHQDRNVYAASMVVSGQADAMVTGLTRAFGSCFEDVLKVSDPAPSERIMTYAMFIRRGQTVFLADTSVAENPDGRALADIAVQTAATARSLGFEPRVALLSYSNFGQPARPATRDVRDAVQDLEQRGVDFEFDGEMQVNVALDYELMQSTYPFCRLTGPANVLVMPGLHAANISQKLLTEFADGTVIGPVLQGLNHAVQITSMTAKVSDVLNAAVFAAIESARK